MCFNGENLYFDLTEMNTQTSLKILSKVCHQPELIDNNNC